MFDRMPQAPQSHGMQRTLRLDSSNRIVLSAELRRAAGLQRGQTLKAFVSPGRIILESEPHSRGKVVKRGKLKVWTGNAPKVPLSEAVEQARRYNR